MLKKKKKEETVVYKCTSWCRSGLYEVDYGWGKPVWISSVNKIVNNTVALMDAKDGGVEALVTLDEKDMEIFEQEQELHLFAQLNPSIVLPHYSVTGLLLINLNLLSEQCCDILMLQVPKKERAKCCMRLLVDELFSNFIP
ncbi:hypothetical protein K1719_041753 [Acacia pycnantha]|nr:hypothetical protein K1719_041753 [Acacia pycnantha]